MTPVRIEGWFDNLDFLVVPLDNHTVTLGLDYFFKSSKVVPMISKNHFVFLDKARVSSVPMKNKRKLGWKPRISGIWMIVEVKEVNSPLHVT